MFIKKQKQLDWVTQMKHHNIAAKFVDEVICQTCIETEGICHIRHSKEAYARCRHFHKTVCEIKKVLDKYNR